MPTSLKAKLRTAASADAGLIALLKNGAGNFRWYDDQLVQGTEFPAVTVFQVSNPSTYAVTGMLPTSNARMQFNVFGAAPGSQNADAVVTAIAAFLTGFNAVGIPNLPFYSNLIVNDRDAGIAQTNPLTYQRILDVMVYSNETL